MKRKANRPLRFVRGHSGSVLHVTADGGWDEYSYKTMCGRVLKRAAIYGPSFTGSPVCERCRLWTHTVEK